MTTGRPARRAEWIWIRPPRADRAGPIPRGEPRADTDANRFVRFRKTFDSAGGVRSAPLRVSADGRYILYLNGSRIARGPARASPPWQCVDPVDVAALVLPGRNVLAAFVHSYGRDTAWYELPRGAQAVLFDCAGFYLEGSILFPDGELPVGTDSSWKFLEALERERDTPFGSTGYAERFDMRGEPAGWTTPDFDDSGWEASVVQRIVKPGIGADIVPFPRLEERDIPALVETPARPVRITEPAGDLRVYDFGGVLLGRVSFGVEARGGTILEIECSEALGDDGRIGRPPEIPGISAPLVHRATLREGAQEVELFEAAGFRYVQVRVLPPGAVSPGTEDPGPRAEARDDRTASDVPPSASGAEPRRRFPGRFDLYALETGYPRFDPGDEERSGAFECADEGLVALWKAGVRTAGVCRQDALIDCPAREQRQWTGDPYVQALVGYAAGSDARLVRRYLLQTARSQNPDGMVASTSASDLRASGRSIVPDFCLLWILAVEKYLLYTGDATVLDELFPAVARALAWFEPYLDDAGLLCDVPGWTFIDWSEALDRRGEVLVLNAFFAGALRAGARVACRVGAPSCGQRWEALAKAVTTAAEPRFRDPGRGCYADAYRPGGAREPGGTSRSPVASQQANAAAVVFDIAPPRVWNRLFGTILDEGRLVLTRTWRWDVERSFDPRHDIVLAQPFFAHFLHQALGRAGRVADILSSLAGRWGPLLAQDDTFRESWQLTPATSRCHGFSATPAYDLSTWVLGIRPLADGFSRFVVEPRIADLAWARGRMPTPAGAIAVAWECGTDSVSIEVRTPPGIAGELRLPGSAGGGSGAVRTHPLKPGTQRFAVPVAR